MALQRTATGRSGASRCLLPADPPRRQRAAPPRPSAVSELESLGVATRPLKTMSLIRFLAAVCLILLQAGCSSAVLSRGPDVGQYSSLSRTFTRAAVIHQLGQPASTTAFRQPRSVAALAAQKHPAFQGSISNRSARVSVIDKYVLRGHIENYKDVYATNGLAIMTLGISELVFLPVAISDAVSTAGDVHHLYMAYSPSNILVAHHLIDTK